MIYTPLPANYQPGASRVFLAFEERGRDVSGLLEFGTVLQIFPGGTSWQLTSERTEPFFMATNAYFVAHQFNDADYVVAMGDPVAISLLIAAAAQVNAGRVCVLRWDRLPCPYCNRFKETAECPRHIVKNGKYAPISVNVPAGIL